MFKTLSLSMKQTIISLVVFSFLFSCVAKKKYDALNMAKSGLEVDKDECTSNLEQEKEKTGELTIQVDALTEKVLELEKENTRLETDLKLLQEQYDKLNKISNSDAAQLALETKKANNLSQSLETKTEALEKKTLELEARTAELNRKTKELESKNAVLNNETKRVQDLEVALAEREKRVKELEAIISNQEKMVESIRSKVANSLLSFSSDELQVEVKDGKVYVSLAQNLLFKSGKYKVDPKGLTALKNLSEVLVKQKDIDIVVEGHTDDVPYKSNGVIQDNWDLSVLRATAVVRELQKNKVDPKRLVPAGRADNSPKQEGKTVEARALNRRIEIVISPSLDELYKLLDSK